MTWTSAFHEQQQVVFRFPEQKKSYDEWLKDVSSDVNFFNFSFLIGLRHYGKLIIYKSTVNFLLLVCSSSCCVFLLVMDGWNGPFHFLTVHHHGIKNLG